MKWALAVAAVILAGCGTTSRHPQYEVFTDMRRQPKYMPQAASPWFADGRASRTPVAGTVPRGEIEPVEPPKENPLPMTMEVLERGQERFNIYCAPCHDKTGSGQGIVAQRAVWQAGNYHEKRIEDLTDAQLYDTISRGKRSMPGYRFQIEERDRWAIVHYVRALQRAWNGKLDDVPPELRDQLR